ncbi:MAG: Gfo/Idh/MocA family oxidoreductase [Kiloniellales bacterium]|nr:Gfo/Idh/MocA family oxidoreductase [Kiloniellales bacterium]
MTHVNFGIVGPGFIAGVVAKSIERSDKAKLAAVSSRRLAKAEAFVADFEGVRPIEGWDRMIRMPEVDAVYIAVPTAAKEEIALAAIAAGKHVLVDKPLPGLDSVKRMTQAAAEKGVVFMDATHFVHHPRTAAIREATADLLGTPRSLHTAFYFPFSDRQNIRFDPELEPMGALGDMAWYSMRAVVEYLRPSGGIARVSALAERDSETGAIVRANGLIGFEDGTTSTFDVGYTAGTAIMDLQLIGTKGMITMDDFVLDWTNSFAFDNPGIRAGFTHRSGMATREAFSFIETPSEVPQDVLMIERFAEAAAAGPSSLRESHARASLETQRNLDAIWKVLREA